MMDCSSNYIENMEKFQIFNFPQILTLNLSKYIGIEK